MPGSRWCLLDPLHAQSSRSWKGLAPEQGDKFDYELAKATKHIKFCVKLDHRQRTQGRYYLHEHPLTATSWRFSSDAEHHAPGGQLRGHRSHVRVRHDDQ